MRYKLSCTYLPDNFINPMIPIQYKTIQFISTFTQEGREGREGREGGRGREGGVGGEGGKGQ